LGETTRGGVKHFFVPDKQVIQRMIDQQYELISQSAQLIPLVEAELNERRPCQQCAFMKVSRVWKIVLLTYMMILSRVA
jgi:hypothetical protein